MLPGQQWSGGEPVGSLLEGDRVLMNLWSYKFWVDSEICTNLLVLAKTK